MFDTKNNIHSSNSAFSWLVPLVEQRTNKSLEGIGGIYPRAPLAPPPPLAAPLGTSMITDTLLMYSTVTITTHFCTTQLHTINSLNRPLAQLLSAHAIGAGDLRLALRVGQIGTMPPTARHRCDVPSERCSQGAKPRRWAPPLVTRFGEIPRV